MYCCSCGEQLPDGAKVCANCGADVFGDVPQRQVAAENAWRLQTPESREKAEKAAKSRHLSKKTRRVLRTVVILLLCGLYILCYPSSISGLFVCSEVSSREESFSREALDELSAIFDKAYLARIDGKFTIINIETGRSGTVQELCELPNAEVSYCIGFTSRFIRETISIDVRDADSNLSFYVTGSEATFLDRILFMFKYYL